MRVTLSYSVFAKSNYVIHTISQGKNKLSKIPFDRIKKDKGQTIEIKHNLFQSKIKLVSFV